jgi:hypothetical protein
MLNAAFENAIFPTVPYIIRELKLLIQKEVEDVS